MKDKALKRKLSIMNAQIYILFLMALGGWVFG